MSSRPIAQFVRRGLLASLLCSLSVLAGCDAESGTVTRPITRDATIDPVTFANLEKRIPGSTWTSNKVVLTGFDGPLLARAEGSERATLQVNGGPRVRQAEVRPGDRVTLNAAAPADYNMTGEVTLVVGDVRTPWQIKTLPAPPAKQFAFKPRKNVKPGSKVYSEFVAPDFFPAGSIITVSGEGEPRLVTKSGSHTKPVKLEPGEPLQIVVNAPNEPGRQREVTVQLGDRSTVWRIATAG